MLNPRLAGLKTDRSLVRVRGGGDELPMLGPAPQAAVGSTRRASKKQLFKSLLSRVSIIESASAARAERAVRFPEHLAVPGAAEGSAGVSSAVQAIASTEALPLVQASSGSSVAAVAGPSQPAALASAASAAAGSTQSVGSTVAAVDVAVSEQLLTAVPAGTARLVHRWRILVVGIIMSTGRRDTPGTRPLASVWVRFHCIGRVEGCSRPSLGRCSVSEISKSDFDPVLWRNVYKFDKHALYFTI
nr:uncharacterized protein LOC132773465 [Anolis sagrei ordinatus]